VLLPVFVLVRRADVVAVIGMALVLAAAGAGFRTVAARVGVAQGTVRGWLHRFRVRAEGWRVVFTRAVAALDPVLGPITARGSVLADAVEVMGLAAAEARGQELIQMVLNAGTVTARSGAIVAA
jgi:hypothetical protein